MAYFCGGDKNNFRLEFRSSLNVEFSWDSNTLPEEQSLPGSPIRITNEMVSVALSKMKKTKATGPSGLNVEMILVGGW